MTALAALRHRPRPWTRLTRAQLQAQIAHVEEARDRALGERRATLDWCAAKLEMRADELAATRSPVRQEIAGELRALAELIEEGPR